ncbi:DJ-1/PfpI family protein [Dechloromonas sp. XY25]|uniref:DJ-1/PfpI family protein n=1 Tax=Dechloromonas hankyongensis TaxID=2908002 RepID=A0ABS9K6F7_9RHOO|nr:DJ-1/PfpI family protein [Dechloromonas hankyongensis]MCG2578757.1 DJ-1/PfpI family protein [Dechloromonas hankyongensis]
MPKRFLIAVLSFVTVFALAQPALSVQPETAPQLESPTRGIPAYRSRFNRTEPIIAVVAENTFTELTDYVVPYGVLAESGVAQVFALATKEGPIQMFPALRVQPQATIAEFDKRFPDGADYVVVPAVHRTEDAALIAWVTAQARKGAIIVGVCDGVWVVANAGLLAGRRAVGHWYSFDDLASKFPKTKFVRNTRYIADGPVITTTGVTASIPVSIALVEAIAGRDRAAALAQTMGIKDWSASHQSDNFKLTSRHALTAAGNWISFWSHEDVAIPVAPGVDEIKLALVADAYSRTYRSTAFSLAATTGPITTRRGLVVFPDKISPLQTANRTIDLPGNVPPVAALDFALLAIEKSYGAATASFVALQIEHHRP